MSDADTLTGDYNEKMEKMKKVRQKAEEKKKKSKEKKEKKVRVWHSPDRLMSVGRVALEQRFAEFDLGRPVTLEFRKREDVERSDVEAMYEIVYETSHIAYANSTLSWNKKSKMKELDDPNMVFAIIRAPANSSDTFSEANESNILAFSSFKLDFDDRPFEHKTVVYIFEVHVSKALRGNGLGSFLISAAEHMAENVGVDKTMLTVFNSNPDAIRLYEKLGYGIDQASPSYERNLRRKKVKNATYTIMSKEGLQGWETVDEDEDEEADDDIEEAKDEEGDTYMN